MVSSKRKSKKSRLLCSRNTLASVKRSPASIWVLLIFGGLIGISASASVNVFTDSFNRPDNDNISASPVGMSGLAAPMIYFEQEGNRGMRGEK